MNLYLQLLELHGGIDAGRFRQLRPVINRENIHLALEPKPAGGYSAIGSPRNCK